MKILKTILSYLGVIILSFLMLIIISIIGANINYPDFTIHHFTFINVFVGLMKIMPLGLLLGFTMLIINKNG